MDRDRCEGHGQCALAAPDAFRLDDRLELHYEERPADTLHPAVEEAVRMCPMQAIELEG